jgi:hypothetical protein
LKAANGQVILTSEGYKTKASAINGAESVMKNSASQDRFEVKKASNEKWHFNLNSSNGQIVGSSQMYTSESGMKNGIESVMRTAPEASIDD